MIATSASADMYLKPESTVSVIIDPTGIVSYTKMINTLKSRCEMEITWFPYDEQKCTFILASLIYDTNFIRYTEKNSEVSNSTSTLILDGFINNKLWDLVKYKYEFVDKVFEGYTEKYAEIHVHLFVKRKPLYVITNLLIPALCLSVMTLISFHIPFAQAMPIGISVVLSFSVLSIRLKI